MSAFGGRRAPNVSQYVANLNTIPSAHDVASQQQDGFNLEDDLAIFTNTEFFDFDMGENTVGPSLEFDPLQDGQTKGEDAAVQAKNDKGLDFLEGTSQVLNHICFLCIAPGRCV